MKLKGQLVQGYRVDSGLSSRDRRFPEGTLRTQEPYFAALGFSFEEYFKGKHVWGSLNMDLLNLSYKQKRSDIFFERSVLDNTAACRKFLHHLCNGAVQRQKL